MHAIFRAKSRFSCLSDFQVAQKREVGLVILSIGGRTTFRQKRSTAEVSILQCFV